MSLYSRTCLCHLSSETNTAARKKRTFEECSPVCSEGYCQLSPESLFVAWRYQRYDRKVGAGIRETHCTSFNIYPVCSRRRGKY